MSTASGTALPSVAGARETDAALIGAVRLFLLLLLCGDVVYLALHAGHLTVPALRGDHFSLETDRGLAEFYQYMKQLWLALCLAIASVRRRHLVLTVWSGFFAFLMLDDALQLHERTGDSLGPRLGLPAAGGLRPEDFGELLFAVTIGVSLSAMLAIAWWRDRATTWALSRDLLVLTAVLAFCGVAVDTLHTIAFFRVPQIADPLAFLEDGGELLVISTLAACGLDLASRGTGAPAGLGRLLRGSRHLLPPSSRA